MGYKHIYKRRAVSEEVAYLQEPRSGEVVVVVRGVGGGAARLCLTLHCKHENDFCIKMGSNVSHFNVSLNCEGQSHKTVSKDDNF